LQACDVDQHGSAIAQLRQGSVTGIIVCNAYDSVLMKRIVERLERHDLPFLKTWFPEKFKSWFYGQNLNLMQTDPDTYFQQAEEFHQHMTELFPAGQGPAPCNTYCRPENSLDRLQLYGSRQRSRCGVLLGLTVCRHRSSFRHPTFLLKLVSGMLVEANMTKQTATQLTIRLSPGLSFHRLKNHVYDKWFLHLSGRCSGLQFSAHRNRSLR
jgi:hypothetical protein